MPDHGEAVDALHVGARALAAHRSLNPPATALPDRGGIPGVFRRCAAEFGARPAVVHGDRTLDYRALDRMSDTLAARLYEAGVEPGHVVAVCVPRSPELVIGLLAILKCGAAYLPVGAERPADLLHDVLEQAGCAVVLTGGAPFPVPYLRQVPADLSADLSAAESRTEPEEGVTWPVPVVDPDAVAYVSFTSGSRGRPKGVLIDHRAVLRLVSGAVYARLGETRRVLHMAPVTFDAATFEIWGALLTGGTCVLGPNGALRLSEVGRVVAEHEVTTVFLTTVLFNAVVDEAPQVLDTVDEILTGGEAHSLRHVTAALDRYGPGRVVHVYGPTESTTFATWHRVTALPPGGRPLPIGRPIQNTRAYVVAGERLCAPGETGELLLAGPGLSPGYLGMPAATAERFVTRSVAGAVERLYRTGDLVHIDSGGELVFEGRGDDQVKINGFRVEPGQVLFHLDRHPDVRQGFVCVAERPSGKALLAFVVPKSAACTADAVRAHLAAALAPHLLPAEVHLVDALPVTSTGKVDHRALLRAVPSRAVLPPPSPDQPSGLPLVTLS